MKPPPTALKQRIRKNRDAKVLAENFFSLSALKVLGYIFPLITLPYLSRVIGVDKFGEIAFAAAIVIYFRTIVDFGFNYTAVRDISRIRNDPEKTSEIFCRVLTAKLLLMLLSFMLLLILISTIPSFTENRLMLLLTFLYIPGYILFPDWFFQAMEEMKYITLLHLLAKVIFTLLVFIVIKEKNDYIYQPVLIASGYFLSGIIAMIIIKSRYKITIIRSSFRDIIHTISESVNMFITLFLPNLYTNFSIILLNIYSGKIATGLYSSGFKFIELSLQFSEVLSRTFYPFLARRISYHRLYVIISFSINAIAGLVLFFSAELLVKIFYTTEFADSARVIKIMAVGPLFVFLMYSYGHNYLVLLGKENMVRNIVIFCSLGGFVLSWLIVPKYSFMGVAITILIVWAIRGFLTWFYAYRHKRSIVTSTDLEFKPSAV